MRPPVPSWTSADGSSAPCGEDAAGPVVLEAPAGEMGAVRNQRGRQRVAGEALKAATVEGEAETLGAVDLPAALQAKAHQLPSPPSASGSHGLGAPMG